VGEIQVRRTLESVTLDLHEGRVTPKAARDTAAFYYAMPGLPKVYKAAAARIICDSYLNERSRYTALQWCQRALDLDSTNTTYQRLVRAFKGDSQP